MLICVCIIRINISGSVHASPEAEYSLETSTLPAETAAPSGAINLTGHTKLTETLEVGSTSNKSDNIDSIRINSIGNGKKNYTYEYEQLNSNKLKSSN